MHCSQLACAFIRRFLMKDNTETGIRKFSVIPVAILYFETSWLLKSSYIRFYCDLDFSKMSTVVGFSQA